MHEVVMDTYLEVDKNPLALKVGEFGFFRYIDADAYDPDGLEIFYGMVTEVDWLEDKDGDPCFSPAYVILSSFGVYVSMGQCDWIEDKYPPLPN